MGLTLPQKEHPHPSPATPGHWPHRKLSQGLWAGSCYWVQCFYREPFLTVLLVTQGALYSPSFSGRSRVEGSLAFAWWGTEGAWLRGWGARCSASVSLLAGLGWHWRCLGPRVRGQRLGKPGSVSSILCPLCGHRSPCRNRGLVVSSTETGPQVVAPALGPPGDFPTQTLQAALLNSGFWGPGSVPSCF